MSRDVVLLGGGGHGVVVLETALAAGLRVVAVYDDRDDLHGMTLLGVPIAGPLKAATELVSESAVAAIGDNETRAAIVERVPLKWATVVHPTSQIAGDAEIDLGTVIFAGAVVQPRTRVAEHAIVNTGAIVDHDCRIGRFVHVSPGATICGTVTVGDGALVGAGAVITPGLTIGKGAVVGAGAVVIQSVADGETVVGNPARPIASR